VNPLRLPDGIAFISAQLAEILAQAEQYEALVVLDAGDPNPLPVPRLKCYFDDFPTTTCG
jgi:hypothetical protein